MVENESTITTNSSMPGGGRITIYLTAVFDCVTITGADWLFPLSSPNLIVGKSQNMVFGIEKIYDMTTETEITGDVVKITDDKIYFTENFIDTGDYIELTIYCLYEGLRTLSPTDITPELIEQFYRHAGSFDRCDFGYLRFPGEYLLKEDTTTYLTGNFKQRLFFNSAGEWSGTHLKYTGHIWGGQALTGNPQTVISWSPNAPHTTGFFVGDPEHPGKEDISGTTYPDFYSFMPVPFYLTALEFWCDLRNDAYNDEIRSCVAISAIIDGTSNIFGVSPGRKDTDDVNLLSSSFGTDNKLLLSFSDVFDYNYLSPTYEMATKWDSEVNTFYYAHIPLGLIRASSINVSAQTISKEEFGVEDEISEIDRWMISFAGYIPYADGAQQ